MMFTNRKNRYWLYFGFAFLASMAAILLIIASILSAGALPAILISHLAIFAGLSLTAALAALVVALIDTYFAKFKAIVWFVGCILVGIPFFLIALIFAAVIMTGALLLSVSIELWSIIKFLVFLLTKIVLTCLHVVACIIYYPIEIILFLFFCIVEFLFYVIFGIIFRLADYVCSNNFTLYLVYAILISLLIGAVAAIAILSLGAAPAVLALLASIAFIGGPISSFIAGLSIMGQFFALSALVALVALIPSTIIATVSSFVCEKNRVFDDWISLISKPLIAYPKATDYGDGMIDCLIDKCLVGGVTIMDSCCAGLKSARDYF